MMNNGKSYLRDIEYYRLYANEQVENIERTMRSVEEEVVENAKGVFRSPDAVTALLTAIDAGMPETRFEEIVRRIESWPQEFGSLVGGWFSPSTTTLATFQAPHVADGLRDFADLVAARATYRQLHQRAINTSRLPPSRQEAALEELKREREFADVTRDTRERDRVYRRDR